MGGKDAERPDVALGDMLTLRCAPVELLAPKERASEALLRMIAVSALEEAPPAKAGKKKRKPLHWMLTTEGGADLDTVCKVLHWSELRWRIERFFSMR